MKRLFVPLILLFLILGGFLLFQNKTLVNSVKQSISETNVPGREELEGVISDANPLSIDALREQEFPGSEMVIEETLAPGSNYSRYIASYQSEGNKIYGLLTVPFGQRPTSGWPVVIFNHGYIPPREYVTTERYIAYTDAFSRNGYVLFRSDYRGHGNSEGEATGGYGSNGYTIDVLNAVSSIKKLKVSDIAGVDPSTSLRMTEEGSSSPLVDSDRIGMWGHSMGGFITLRSMVVSRDIKAGVIWGGVVASYPDLINNWRRGNNQSTTPSPLPSGARRWRQVLVEQFGEPTDSSPFWRSLSANNYLKDISGPVQLHHGTLDESVPYQFSEKLEKQMKAAGKEVEYYPYDGDDHDITGNFGVAMERSVEFFDRYVKGN
jgi:uncharacterized protein